MIDITAPMDDPIVLYGISLLAAAMSLAWLVQCWRNAKLKFSQMLTGVASLWVLSFVGSYFGWFHRLDMLPPPTVLAGAFAGALTWLAANGPVGAALARTMNYRSLVVLQVFRLPLELVMLRAASLSVMPVEFSMRGYNFDALTGLSALFIWLAMSVPNWVSLRLVSVWNIFGMACLAVIGVLAVLTSPLVAAFGSAPTHINTWILFFPYSLLPLVLVSAAVFGHLVLTRKLALEKLLQFSPTKGNQP